MKLLNEIFGADVVAQVVSELPKALITAALAIVAAYLFLAL